MNQLLDVMYMYMYMCTCQEGERERQREEGKEGGRGRGRRKGREIPFQVLVHVKGPTLYTACMNAYKKDFLHDEGIDETT